MTKCTKCNSTDTIKMGITQAKIPKQRHFCKGCHSFFTKPLQGGDQLSGAPVLLELFGVLIIVIGTIFTIRNFKKKREAKVSEVPPRPENKVKPETSQETEKSSQDDKTNNEDLKQFYYSWIIHSLFFHLLIVINTY